MDNTPTAEADSLDVQTRTGSNFLFTNAVRDMYGSISLAASSCQFSNTGKHRFQGYPHNKAKCRSCGTPLFRIGG